MKQARSYFVIVIKNHNSDVFLFRFSNKYNKVFVIVKNMYCKINGSLWLCETWLQIKNSIHNDQTFLLPSVELHSNKISASARSLNIIMTSLACSKSGSVCCSAPQTRQLGANGSRSSQPWGSWRDVAWLRSYPRRLTLRSSSGGPSWRPWGGVYDWWTKLIQTATLWDRETQLSEWVKTPTL